MDNFHPPAPGLDKVGIIIFITCLIASVGCQQRIEPVEGVTTFQINIQASFSELSWSPDGNFIAALADEGKNRRSVIIIDVNSGDYHSIIDYGNRNLSYANGISWSPDSESLILYYPVNRDVSEVGLALADIVVVNAQTGEISLEVGPGGYAAWGANQNEVVIIESDVGRSGTEVPIKLFDLETNQIQVLGLARPDIASVYEILDVSSTGNIIYPTNDRWAIITTQSGDLLSEIDAEYGAESVRSPRWSPDGQILAYLEESFPDGNNAIRLATNDGSCQSIPLELIASSLDWSPNGNKLVYSPGRGKQEHGNIYFLDFTIGAGRELMNSFQTCRQ